ncbi:hypothetical protein HanXRQr2_Chr01g0011351 [Helianthus annuus]|uniref:Uncharacterized protein n=1 Tax=Helianthus annuus TaxID=4232 RepID=A0A9K3P3Q5_HELAN|nr:hypothetical protein HanXRQr2_Chr01g0011351 [Helianthus annuus]
MQTYQAANAYIVQNPKGAKTNKKPNKRRIIDMASQQVILSNLLQSSRFKVATFNSRL